MECHFALRYISPTTLGMTIVVFPLSSELRLNAVPNEVSFPRQLWEQIEIEVSSG